ncbi:MAG: aminomethyl-transferring glycine dehydrogenase subunit GcvPB [Candidatus Scalindua sp.]|jgi:glycine dehydrogenase subunit 2|nr:aminomethyl-transferring glycine dehydrogenase subunit GcvPB [Candidatus Scalindua sp.]MDV5167066.1 aminomethyl-transferring glycine dehydrogenase subunit GcvPB [Candidatus Scalindua sp.]
MKLLNEKSKQGRSSFNVGLLDIQTNIPDDLQRTELNLPELPEVEVVRHYTNLSNSNFGVDNGLYPLGSCTMKYNPKINEIAANISQFNLHPLSHHNRGTLEIIYQLQQYLCEITGMHAFSTQPAAGAHGELTGIMIMKAWFEKRGEQRTKVIIPDSCHGTNPASVSLCRFEPVHVKSSSSGGVDLEDLRQKMSRDVVGIMITNPNTLGIFDENIQEITQTIHDYGGLCYLDGANMNPMLGVVKPGDFGIDIMHLNLHKTFSTPHGGGGPGSGPVGVVKDLEPFLPNPRISMKKEKLEFEQSEDSIGRVHSFYGNFGILLRAYSYIRSIGASGLRNIAENAVLNANYMKEKLKKHYHLPYDRICQHELVIDDSLMPNGVTTNDIAKRLMDFGFHPPTIYFPLIVKGAMLIEPTETETKENLDAFVDAMKAIKEEAENEPEKLTKAPLNASIGRLDIVRAARKPKLTWFT